MSETRSHVISMRDFTISTVFFAGAFYLIHLRGHADSFGLWDTAAIASCIVAGLLVGYRDRIGVLTTSFSRIARARFSGKFRGPDE